MSERSAKGCLLATLLWCVILAVLGVGYRFLVHPYLSEKLKGQTGSSSQYKDEITVAADSFSGYCILRSDALKQELRSRQIRFTIQDDQADYAARLKALREGKVHMAVFTVDSLIAAGAKAGDFPATIVLVIDETKGGDAIVAQKSAVASLQELNHPGARFVLTPNSPSEFLARVVIAHFNLPQLSSDWLIQADGARAVYNALRAASPADKRAYVLWEPYVSKALEKPGVQVLLDSSKLEGYIVDVLVAQRSFLRDHPDKVRAVVEAYSRAAYQYSQQANGLVELVRADARATGAESLDDAQAKQIVRGIQWRNTLENYAHFGLVSGPERGGLPLLEDIIGNIIDVLVKTKAIPADPLPGQYYTLFYDRILAEMKAANFHPGKNLNLISDVGPAGADPEKVRGTQALAELTPEQWTILRPVGELKVEPIAFSRGSANITVQSERDLQQLAKRLQSFPLFYLRVIGHTRSEGDADANRRLAQARAEAAAQFLISQGVAVPRIRTEAAPAALTGGEAQSVSFVVGQLPY
jgi:outer membrane protein OmpA-like peptidoglycan-associated protein/ABC-type taurine transport system substrate-binding protein